mmetsp:Transcript_30182/g.63125  ORF Transcript_30182/g.63125 Transcript_30182/m.63125 type:complete len:204 (+) Transcript_30182:216-827(+)
MFHWTPSFSKRACWFFSSFPFFFFWRWLSNQFPSFLLSSPSLWPWGTREWPSRLLNCTSRAYMLSHFCSFMFHTTPTSSRRFRTAGSSFPDFLSWRWVVIHKPRPFPSSLWGLGTWQSPSRSLYRRRRAIISSRLKARTSQTIPISFSWLSLDGLRLPLFSNCLWESSQDPRLLPSSLWFWGTMQSPSRSLYRTSKANISSHL